MLSIYVFLHMKTRDWTCSSVGKSLPSIHKALCMIARTKTKKQNKMSNLRTDGKVYVQFSLKILLGTYIHVSN